MDPEKPPSLRSRLLQTVAGIIVVLTLYVVSSGPVAYVTIRTGLNPGGLEEFYAPLGWLRESTPLKVPLERYLMWWSWHGFAHRNRQLNPPERAPVPEPIEP